LPRLPRWTAAEAESVLRKNQFELIRTKGSHRIYRRGNIRVTVPFHSGRILHPKIVKQVLRAVEL
jgi:predicted RNA binding protein YcfA (HicA-like mRNA interferase family)